MICLYSQRGRDFPLFAVLSHQQAKHLVSFMSTKGHILFEDTQHCFAIFKGHSWGDLLYTLNSHLGSSLPCPAVAVCSDYSPAYRYVKDLWPGHLFLYVHTMAMCWWLIMDARVFTFFSSESVCLSLSACRNARVWIGVFLTWLTSE